MSTKLLAVPLSIALTFALALLGSSIHSPLAPSTEIENAQDQPTQKKNTKKKAAAAQKDQGTSVPPPSAAEAGVPILSNGDSYDDFPSIAQLSNRTLVAAYAAYYNGHDQVRIHKRLPDGIWSTRSYVPLVESQPDIWMPQLAVDAKDRVWLIWSEQTGRDRGKTGNWDLYARALDGDSWGALVRLTDDPKPDVNPHVAIDAQHNIYVVWQGHAKNNGDIMLCRFDGQDWSKPVTITSGSESDWYPQVAVDTKGVAWIAFDSYRNGDYDVFLTSYDHGKVGDVIPIATSKFYEAHPSVACTPDGRVWVAWEQGGWNWGKDQGYWLRIENRLNGSALGSARTVHVAAYQDSKLSAAPLLTDALPEGEREFNAMAGLATDGDGRLWLRFRHRKLTGARRYWTENVTHLTRGGWAPVTELPGSAGRISVFSRMLAAAEGSLHVIYSADGRTPANFHQPRRDQVLVSTSPKTTERPEFPRLVASEPPARSASGRDWNFARENQQVDAIRTHEIRINDATHRIVRGDLHRHTELSWDVGPGNDGSYLDFYRYMIDVAAMDFGGLSDHQGGGHYAYWWWLTEKSSDMYYLPPRFIPLYGYERSVVFPNGHRNVFHSYRGVPVFPFQLKLDQKGEFPGVGTGAVVENDTKLLYQYLHKSGGIAISHTSGTNMGTDWRDNDPDIEPVVEIYQGARNSYEVLGGPRVHDEDKLAGQAPGGYKPEGMIWNAYAKGYRLGTITSSDHGSTHISYALVYTPEKDRAAIIDSIRKRHTYGATDNLIVDFRANGHFMGDEFSSSDKPVLELRATGTAKIARVDLVRNNEYIYSTEPGKQTIEIKHSDGEPKAGSNLYYFRLLQEDGELAWTSPIWVTYGAK
jgi:hypothetical protein